MSLERLSNDAIDEQSLIALEHRHRYEFAAGFCAGLRVVDLCCGVGYGSAILSRTAAVVRGIDVDAGSIDEAERAHGDLDRLSFSTGDAVEWLGREDAADEVDVLVCFEGLEHLADDGPVLDGLERLARRGVRLLLSMPNSRRYEEDNAFHLTNFDREAVDRWARRLGADAVLGQWNAEGTLIAPEADDALDGVDLLAATPPAERRPHGWAMHYVVLVNTSGEAAPGGRLAWAAEPANARWAQSLHRGNRELWVENARLESVQTRGTYSAGAAAALHDWRRRAAELELGDREADVDRREREVSRREIGLERQTADLARREAALQAWELVIKERERDIGLDPDRGGSGSAALLQERTRELEAQQHEAARLAHEVAVLTEVRRRRAVRLALGGSAVLRRLRRGR